MLLQPQPLPQHLLHRVLDRIAPAAGDCLDLGPRGPQPRLQGVGGVQYLGQGTLAAAASAAQREQQQGGQRQQQQQHVNCGQGQGPGRVEAQSAVRPRERQIPRRGKDLGLTARVGPSNISSLMSADSHESRPGVANTARLPGALDAWRMVAARRGFEGTLPLSSMERLREVLCDTEGEIGYVIAFDRDALQVPYVELRVQAALPLTCQRSLQRFVQPVQLVQRLALLEAGTDVEAAEAGLPEGYEALLVPPDGTVQPAELIEDELILAVPVVPVAPGSEAVEQDWPLPGTEAGEELEKANPFAALAALKKRE